MRRQGGTYRGWYVGITSDWEERLFTGHQVPRKDCWFIARLCHSNADARSVEEALLKLGCDGRGGGGDQTAVYVYA